MTRAALTIILASAETTAVNGLQCTNTSGMGTGKGRYRSLACHLVRRSAQWSCPGICVGRAGELAGVVALSSDVSRTEHLLACTQA